MTRSTILLLSAVLLAGMPAAAATPFQAVGTPTAAQPVHFDVFLPLRNRSALDTLLRNLHDPASPQFHHWLTPAEFGLRFGPTSEAIERVTSALKDRGFSVQTHTRSLHVIGPAALAEAEFGVKLMLVQAETPSHIAVASAAELKMPPELAAYGAQIFSFWPHAMHTMSERVSQPAAGVDNRKSATGAYWYDDLKQAYSYPSNQATITTSNGVVPLNGTGVTIAALMSSDVLDSDINAMFNNENWSATTGTPDPALWQHVAIDGGGGTTGGTFEEASLDTQMEIGGAPGAHVILYNIPSLSDGDIMNGYVNIIEDNVTDLVSSSFGQCELDYFPKHNGGVDQRGLLRAEHELFMQGNAQGITFLASSGDRAGVVCVDAAYPKNTRGHFIKGISSPASDPNVTAVGGTNRVTTYDAGQLDSIYVSENAWSDPEKPVDFDGDGDLVYGGSWGAGGGYSRMWPQPDYQSLVDTGSTVARSTPDIGMQVGGCPTIAKERKQAPHCDGGNNPLNGNGDSQRSSVEVAVNVGLGGGFTGLVGTSVSSPEFASAVATLIEQNGRMGNLNYYIYRLAARQLKHPDAAYFHVNIPGYNGLVETLLNSGYSLSVGVGTPIVSNFIGATTAPLAGTPQTLSNP